jgi:hypothetical protein
MDHYCAPPWGTFRGHGLEKDLRTDLQYKLLTIIQGSSHKVPNRLRVVNAIMNTFNDVRKSLNFKKMANKVELASKLVTNKRAQ